MEWALILGASSGFGGAAALELARAGMNVFGVHLDRQATMPLVQHIVRHIRHTGREAVFFNINAADAIKRNETLDEIQERFHGHAGHTVRVLVHSLAFGTLKPFIAKSPEDAITQAQMEMTVDVMANSLVYWTQGLVSRHLMKKGGRIFAMTSSGGHSVIPSYGAVSAAKSALESEKLGYLRARQAAYCWDVRATDVMRGGFSNDGSYCFVFTKVLVCSGDLFGSGSDRE